MSLTNVEPFGTYIRPDQAEALRARSEATRVPTAVLVRDAIDLWLRACGGEVAAAYAATWRAT